MCVLSHVCRLTNDFDTHICYFIELYVHQRYTQTPNTSPLGADVLHPPERAFEVLNDDINDVLFLDRRKEYEVF